MSPVVEALNQALRRNRAALHDALGPTRDALLVTQRQLVAQRREALR